MFYISILHIVYSYVDYHYGGDYEHSNTQNKIGKTPVMKKTLAEWAILQCGRDALRAHNA